MILAIAGLASGSYVAYKGASAWKSQQQYKQFDNGPKDVLIIHCFPKVELPIPSAVPWVLKIELLCKMLGISYQKDYEYPWGPKGKTPWISYNGTHMGDSQLITEFLLRQFPKITLNESIEPDKLAVARAVRVMLEERFYWALPLWRWIWEDGESHFYQEFGQIKLPFNFPMSIYRYLMGRTLWAQMWGHGIGRHSKEDIIGWMKGDLRTVSVILGDRKFITGNKPCTEDAAIFGMLVQPVYGMPGSPYDEFVKAELPNLKEYCDRVIEHYGWTDFES